MLALNDAALIKNFTENVYLDLAKDPRFFVTHALKKIDISTGEYFTPKKLQEFIERYINNASPSSKYEIEVLRKLENDSVQLKMLEAVGMGYDIAGISMINEANNLLFGSIKPELWAFIQSQDGLFESLNTKFLKAYENLIDSFLDFFDPVLTEPYFGDQREWSGHELITVTELVYKKMAYKHGLDLISVSFILSDRVQGAVTSGPGRYVHISDKKKLSTIEFLCLIVHEFMHLFRSLISEKNHPNKKLYALGTADFLADEEGLGILMEAITRHYFGHSWTLSVSRAVDRYRFLCLVLGLDGKQKSIADVGVAYSSIFNTDKNRVVALMNNCSRGMDTHIPGLAYWRMKLYLEGFMENVDYWARRDKNNTFMLFDKIMKTRTKFTTDD